MAVQVAHEILHELLDAVAHYSEWDITMKARSLKRTTAARSSLMELVVNGPQFDLCSIIRATVPARVLASYSLKSRTEVLQLKCVDQKESGYCGHYALYYALCGLELCRSTSQASVFGYLDELDQTGPFWRRYWLSVEELMANGDMERSYMWYLLSEDSHSQFVGGAKLINVLQYAYGQFNSSVASICELQDKIDVFCTAAHPVSMAVVLGVTNHWLTVLAYRIPDCGRVGVLYMDSNNTPILRVSDEELNRILVTKEQDKIRRKGEGYSPWQRTIRLQAWKDQRRVLDVLSYCLSGKHNLRTELLDSSWGSLLDSYYSCVCSHGEGPQTICTGHQTMCLLLLVQWLQVERHPKSISEVQVALLRQVGVQWVSTKLLAKVIRWMGDVRDVCKCSSGIEETNTLLLVLDELEECIKQQHSNNPHMP